MTPPPVGASRRQRLAPRLLTEDDDTIIPLQKATSLRLHGLEASSRQRWDWPQGAGACQRRMESGAAGASAETHGSGGCCSPSFRGVYRRRSACRRAFVRGYSIHPFRGCFHPANRSPALALPAIEQPILSASRSSNEPHNELFLPACAPGWCSPNRFLP